MQRPGEVTDLVVASGEIGKGAAVAAPAQPLGDGGEAADGPGDGAGQVDRKQHGHAQRHGEHFEDAQANLEQGGLDIARSLGQHQRPQDLLVPLDRHGDAEDHAAVAAGAHRVVLLARERPRHLVIVFGPLDGFLVVGGHRILDREPQDQAVVNFQRRAHHLAVDVRWRQLADLDHAAGAHQQAAVGQQYAVGAEQARTRARGLHQAADDLVGDVADNLLTRLAAGGDRALAEGGGEHIGLGHKRREFGVDKGLPVLAEIQQSGNQDTQRQHIHRENAPGDRRNGAPPWPVGCPHGHAGPPRQSPRYR